MALEGSELFLFVNLTNLALSLFLLNYTLRAYKYLSDKGIEKTLKLPIIAFGLSTFSFLIKIGQEFGFFWIVGPKGRGYLDDLILILANLMIIYALFKVRRLFLALEVNKKANKLLREIIDDPSLSEMGNTESSNLKRDY